MRIVGGLYRGRKLIEFKGNDIRPTSDMVRESLFNILRNQIRESSFLDLFCGTGAMGIEALSRGARRVVFNDLSKDSLKILSQNLSKIGISEGYSVSHGSAIDFLDIARETFDIIYIDPPYASDLGIKALNKVLPSLSNNGIVILEDEKPFSQEIEGLILFDQRKYGRVHLTFFKRKE